MKKERLISPEINDVAKKIEQLRDQLGRIPTASELISITSPQEQGLILSIDEVALVLSAIAGREISLDYVKQLRRSDRLAYAKKISERAYVYRLRDVLFVTLKRAYASKPGRPKKTVSDIA